VTTIMKYTLVQEFVNMQTAIACSSLNVLQ